MSVSDLKDTTTGALSIKINEYPVYVASSVTIPDFNHGVAYEYYIPETAFTDVNNDPITFKMYVDATPDVLLGGTTVAGGDWLLFDETNGKLSGTPNTKADINLKLCGIDGTEASDADYVC